jgi:hypothetical protein
MGEKRGCRDVAYDHDDPAAVLETWCAPSLRRMGVSDLEEVECL